MTSDRGVFAVSTIGLTIRVRCIFAVVALLPVVRPAHADAADTAIPKPVAVDADRVRAAGLRDFVGKHLTLYTDLPATPALAELPLAFDAAVPQWCRFFKVDPARVANWRMHAFLMKDKARFVAAGVLPASLPEFKNGFCADADLWFYEQPTDYYRRHLLLHEGTHGFMLTLLGSCGTAWFSEGVAELAATHRWDSTAPSDRRLTLGDVPRNREEVPAWGRIATIKADLKAGRFRTIADLVDDSVRGYSDVESYAWCWTLSFFLSHHPRYRDRFMGLLTDVAKPDFNDLFRKRFAADRDDMNREWTVFVRELEYGVDVGRVAIDFRPGAPPPVATAPVDVAADRGWQSSGLKLEAGKTYRVRATGRFQVAAVDGKSWPCEAGGITIRYYRGRPLGILLGAIEPDATKPVANPANSASGLIAPIEIGLETTLTPTATGTLYLRTNDSNGELSDNAGSLRVEVTPLP